MPGTPFPLTPAMMASLDAWKYLGELPHSGGDPELSATRASRGGASVRLLDLGEKVRKPACTVEVGGRNFEITDDRTGRKPSGDGLGICVDILRMDLPSSGWSSVPADMGALDEEKEAFEDFRRKVSLRLLGHEDPIEALALSLPTSPRMWSIVDDAGRFDDVVEEGRIALRDEYARKATSL